VAQRRAKGFRILPSAWESWEELDTPGRLEATIDALFALPNSDVTLARLRPDLPVWELSATHEGRVLFLLGARDGTGAWAPVEAVTARKDGPA
jgi:hypothetical protein